MDVVLVVGRVLFVLLFVMSGLTNHLSKQGVEYARSYNAPSPELLVPASGVVIVVGALSVALGIWADIGALLLIAFLVGVTPIMHAYWKETDPQQRVAQQVNFTKNVSMLGGAIIIFWLYNQLQDVDGSITDALIGKW